MGKFQILNFLELRTSEVLFFIEKGPFRSVLLSRNSRVRGETGNSNVYRGTVMLYAAPDDIYPTVKLRNCVTRLVVANGQSQLVLSH